MNRRVSIGISTCPNDTFAFHGLLTNAVDPGDLDFDFQLLDVQELNERLLAGEFDVAKVSFHAALMSAGEIVVLPSGSALGFGVGPVLLAARPGELPDEEFRRRYHREPTVLCPGSATTATMLLQLFYPGVPEPDQVVFSEIMPRLQTGTADFGVCIHEGRFTYEQHGLYLVEDLGARWETRTRSPLPLGGIVARRTLGAETILAIQSAIFDSIRYGLADRRRALPTMRRLAQEFEDDVLMAHVDLYVNRWTEHLGEQGRQAIATLSHLARRAGVIRGDAPALEVFGG